MTNKPMSTREYETFSMYMESTPLFALYQQEQPVSDWLDTMENYTASRMAAMLAAAGCLDAPL